MIDKMLHMATAGHRSYPVVLSEDAVKAKKLLKTNKMAQGDDEHARAMRAYWRGVVAGRNVAYLLKQKGDAGKGAKHAENLMSEAVGGEFSSMGWFELAEGVITENAGQTIWTQLRQMKLNGFPLPAYLGAKNPSASNDGLTVDLRGKWKGRVIIKLNKATDLYDLTFGRVRKYEWIEDSKVLGVEVGNLAHVLQRYVEYGEAKKKRTKKGKTISAGVLLGAMPLVEAKKIIAQTWEFKKKGSAEKFYRMMLNLARREKATWHPELNSTGLRVRVSGESYGSGKITPIDQTTFNKLDSLAAAHKGRKTNSQTEDADDEGGEQLDEMFIGRQMRYVDPQELQYTLEDAATACERNWSERKGHRDMKTLQAPHEALVKSLRAAAAKAGDYATVYKRRMDEL